MLIPRRRITKAYLDFAIRRYSSLVGNMSLRMSNHMTPQEDLESYEAEELLKCMVCYNGTGSFTTFFYGRLRGAFAHQNQSNGRLVGRNNVPIEAVPEALSTNTRLDTRLIAQECLECLEEYEKDVLVDIFWNSKTIRQVAEEWDCTPSAVHKIKSDAINRIRQQYGVEC